ncbi:MAG: YeeE/YedE family protein [Cytophagales bacterium]|nr:YeeE/YedE family protein [Cytophagales bacterium]
MLAPLVPDFINEQMSWLLAVVIGFGFGFALEQAGFSSSRKLAGLFYGYDFTVLRVFFTAGITAMLGTLVFAKLGWLDLELIYVNPAYLHAAVVGGAVMGLGFIIGGFCPGTSLVAASVGRIDAMFFVLGGALGIFLFGELFPLYSDLYTKDFLGAPLIGEWVGISKETAALSFVIIALVAFAATFLIEKKVNRQAIDWSNSGLWLYSSGFALLLYVPALYIVFAPDYKESIWARAGNLKQVQERGYPSYSADKLAYKLLNPDGVSIQLIDLRDSVSYAQDRIPTAIRIPLSELLDSRWETVLKRKNQRNVFYAGDELTAKRACYIAEQMRYKKNYVLSGGWDAYNRTINSVPALGEKPSVQERFNHRFRTRAKVLLAELARKHRAKPQAKPKKKKKILGGCS